MTIKPMKQNKQQRGRVGWDLLGLDTLVRVIVETEIMAFARQRSEIILVHFSFQVFRKKQAKILHTQ